jgi:hypothetical protein
MEDAFGQVFEAEPKMGLVPPHEEINRVLLHFFSSRNKPTTSADPLVPEIVSSYSRKV